jgi:hypothetical protein
MFEVRLAHHFSGLIRCDRPEATLWVRSRYGDFVEIRFVVDTGADLTTIPIFRAERQGIGFRRHQPGVAAGLVGRAQRYRDEIALLIGGEPFVWPCQFVETPSEVRGSVLPVLGRAGLCDVFDFCLGRTAFTLTRRGRLLARLRRWWPFRRVHEPDEPL